MSDDQTIYSLRARVAALSRKRVPNHPELVRARRNLNAALIAKRIGELSTNPPPLTPRQREVIMSAFAGFAIVGGDGE